MNEYAENWEEFTDWFQELNRLSMELFGLSYSTAEDWQDYFDDGYSPKDALNEDFNNV